ncbi:hypothetical protein EDD18DRAFT_1357522 [Armillaria luteobubalina]|uniref:Uncharacterized protein n=1 Tax=Armillaria luteobubalina TaxID=153913 RepID=A0AA39UQ87_9AGAR|nr:hypothetical protein EDD18DRAFT_1357522 [Armillaria luteobubalina]
MLRFVQRLMVLISLHFVNPDPYLLLSLVSPQLSSSPKGAEDTGYNPLIIPQLKSNISCKADTECEELQGVGS